MRTRTQQKLPEENPPFELESFSDSDETIKHDTPSTGKKRTIISEENPPAKRIQTESVSSDEILVNLDSREWNLNAMLSQREHPTLTRKANGRYKVSFATRAFAIFTGSLYTQDFSIEKEIPPPNSFH
jgi:hypothetical protein